MEFPEYLKKLRMAAGYTQKNIADLLGMDRSTYAYYETGKTEPNIRNLKKLSTLYNVRIEDLVNCRDLPSVLSLSSSSADSESTIFLEVFRKLTEKEQQLVMLYRSCEDKDDFLAFVRSYEKPVSPDETES